MQPCRVIVNGANGKMGSLACKTIDDHSAFELVGRLGRQDDLKTAIHTTSAQLVIDLTRADAVYENTLTIIKQGVFGVIGTSGLTETEIKTLSQLCDEKQLGCLIVPNFSISALLMMRFAADAARLLPEVEIIETHHPQKLDAPSGTAIKTAELIAKARRNPRASLHLKELLTGARGASHHDVNIHSLRIPGIIACQEVVFGNTGETLSITHNTIDRSSFMPGLILACERVQTLQSLYYGLEPFLD